MKKYIYLFLFVLIGGQASAQQYVDFAQLRNDLVISNPAAFSTHYLKFGNTNTVTVAYKDQWTNFENSPKTYGFQYRNVYEPMNISYGITALKDETGAISNFSLAANFAYHLAFDRKKENLLTLGLSGGISQYNIQLSAINFQEVPNVSSDRLSQMSGELNVGAFFTKANKFYVGFSIPQLVQTGSVQSENLGINKTPHYFINGGGYIPVKNFIVEPQVNLSYQSHSPLNFMGGVLLNHESGLMFGFGMNNSGQPNAMVGYTLEMPNSNNLSTSFSYGERLGNLNSILGSSIELNLTYSWGQSKHIYCPRF